MNLLKESASAHAASETESARMNRIRALKPAHGLAAQRTQSEVESDEQDDQEGEVHMV